MKNITQTVANMLTTHGQTTTCTSLKKDMISSVAYTLQSNTSNPSEVTGRSAIARFADYSCFT
jgi:hypothetical protein